MSWNNMLNWSTNRWIAYKLVLIPYFVVMKQSHPIDPIKLKSQQHLLPSKHLIFLSSNLTQQSTLQSRLTAISILNHLFTSSILSTSTPTSKHLLHLYYTSTQLSKCLLHLQLHHLLRPYYTSNQPSKHLLFSLLHLQLHLLHLKSNRHLYKSNSQPLHPWALYRLNLHPVLLHLVVELYPNHTLPWTTYTRVFEPKTSQFHRVHKQQPRADYESTLHTNLLQAVHQNYTLQSTTYELAFDPNPTQFRHVRMLHLWAALHTICHTTSLHLITLTLLLTTSTHDFTVYTSNSIEPITDQFFTQIRFI